MATVNKVIIIGNLGQDPEVRFMPSGEAVANLSVATTEAWKDKSGEKQEHVEWHRVSLFGKLATVAGEYLKKGGSVYIEGKIRTKKWKDKDGADKYTTEIVGERMQMLGSRPAGAAKSEGAPAQKAAPKKGGFDEMDSDIPF